MKKKIIGILISMLLIFSMGTVAMFPSEAILKEESDSSDVEPISKPITLSLDGSKDYCLLYRNNGVMDSFWGDPDPGEIIITYLDPSDCGGSDPYPFEIQSFQLSLYDPYPTDHWPHPVDVVVYDMLVAGDPCQGPGSELYRQSHSCDRPSFEFPSAGTIDFITPLCVYKPFFIGIEYMTSGWRHPTLGFDSQNASGLYPCDCWRYSTYSSCWRNWDESWPDDVGFPFFWVIGETKSCNCSWGHHKMHYPQLPDPEGWDVLSTPPVFLADDWLCTESGWIRDIHFWGSWKDDVVGEIYGFWLYIHEDIPANESITGYSTPGQVLWSEYITDFTEVPMPLSDQGWFDPLPPFWDHPNHNLYFRYDITNFTNLFYQENGTIYWLRILADVEDAGYPELPLWGWKTSLHHWNDEAVWASFIPGPSDVTLLSEDFEGSFPPPNWTVDNYGGDCVWENNSITGKPNYAGGSGICANTDSDWCGSGTTMDTVLTTSPLDLRNFATATLNFTAAYDDLMTGEDYADVDISVTGGLSWINLLHWDADHDASGPGELVSLDLTPYVGLPDVLIRWYYYAPNWSWYYQIDDVMITGGLLWYNLFNPEPPYEKLDLAFVITGDYCDLDCFKKVWSDTLGGWDTYTSVSYGSNVRYNISIHNNGTVDIWDTYVFDLLPPSFEYANNATVNGNPDEPDIISVGANGTYLEWNNGGLGWDLSPCNWLYIEYDATVRGERCHEYSNKAFANGSCSITDDLIESNVDRATVHVTWEHKMHYPQLPDPHGVDILATMPIVAADDWNCSETGPVDDIRFWGSWFNDLIGTIDGFWVSIHSNLPENPPYPSMPGNMLWTRYFTDFDVIPMEKSLQGWFDVEWEDYYPDNHEHYFRYDIENITDPFNQEIGTIYWLCIGANVTGNELWGWKNSQDHYMDDAFWGYRIHDVFDWSEELYEPPNFITSLDLAFIITGEGEEVSCGDCNNDEIVDVGDVVYLINYLFRNGDPPIPMACVGDIQDPPDGVVDVGDVVYLINYLFRGGDPPNTVCCSS